MLGSVIILTDISYHLSQKFFPYFKTFVEHSTLQKKNSCDEKDSED